MFVLLEDLKGFGALLTLLSCQNSRRSRPFSTKLWEDGSSVECCLLMMKLLSWWRATLERSAGMRQSDSDDDLFIMLKAISGNKTSMVTGIDPERDALRMANHTRVFHHKPTLDEYLRLFANSTIPVKVQFNGLVKQ